MNKNEMVKVSVIIPTYGVPIYLDQAIQSVIHQTVNEWELIVVDDNNPQTEGRTKTEQLMDKYQEDSRIIYIKHEKNHNGAAARNTGLNRTSGEYISFLDSDDEYHPERLQKCLAAMEAAFSNVAGVYTGCEFRRKGKVYHAETNVRSGRFLTETLACTFMFCTGSNIFMRKSVIDEIGGFDESFLRHQDYEFLVRVFEKYSIIGISEVLVIKNNENFNRPNVEKQEQIKNQYLTKYRYIIDELPQEDQRYIEFCSYIALAEAAMSENKIKKANDYYRKAKHKGKLSIKIWVRRLAFPIYNLFR